jgi:hypothetical protein
MHNRALHDTLVTFVEEAAWQLAEEVSRGAEIRFELIEQGRPTAPLYCYRPLTSRFITERGSELARLPSHPVAARALEGLPDLVGYLRLRGRRAPTGERRVQADAVLQALLCAVWADATDFVFDHERFEAAYAELEQAAYAGCSLATVITVVEGLVIESDQVELGDGLALVRGVTLSEAPPDLSCDDYTTVAVLRLDSPAGEGASLEEAGRRLRRLQASLRLWDDAEPALGPAAWARSDDGPWVLVPLAMGIRRQTGDCLLPAEEEDPLRAFCSLVSRRTPRSGELAWALRRFELGCERVSAAEALTDWLLAARALLAQRGALGYDHVSERLAAICATPEQREALAASVEEAIALERRTIAGMVRSDPAVEEVVSVLAGSLRAMLRDVLCGHLDPDLRRVADELLTEDAVSTPG